MDGWCLLLKVMRFRNFSIGYERCGMIICWCNVAPWRVPQDQVWNKSDIRVPTLNAANEPVYVLVRIVKYLNGSYKSCSIGGGVMNCLILHQPTKRAWCTSGGFYTVWKLCLGKVRSAMNLALDGWTRWVWFSWPKQTVVKWPRNGDIKTTCKVEEVATSR